MTYYDVIVIGAGIHGAGIAQAASVQGCSCLVLEQFSKPAEGTSSRSSKLIHGGLRYLESGQFRLVRECLREQRLLIKNAPDLVHYIPFYIPVYKTSRRPAWMIRLGLMMYRALGGRTFRTVPKAEWGNLHGIDTHGLEAVFQYWDAQTDDRKLTEAVLFSAQSHGCQCQFKATLESANRLDDGYIVQWTDAQGDSLQAKASVLVNASGPWVNDVLARIESRPPQLDIDLVAGTHIILSGKLDCQIYYLEAPQDQRAVFVMPWYGHIMIGTTERLFTGKPEDIRPSEEDVKYLLDVYRHYFPEQMKGIEVLDSFAGLRVLPQTGSDAFHRSRDTVLYPDVDHRPRLFTVYGGKLTAYRATAEKLMKEIMPILDIHSESISTKSIPLHS